MSGLAAAVGLLTRLPLPGATASDPGRGLPWFPVVGVVLGGLAALVYAAAQLVVPPIVAATLATAALALATGALHEDGLADSADAWGGGATSDETLRILRDPAHGTYGTLALVVSVLLRVGAIAALPPAAAFAALPAVHALSRTTAVGVMATTPSARPDGLGARFQRAATPLRTSVAVTAAIGLSAAFIGAAVVPAVAIAVFIGALVRRAAVRRIGGVTGDVLGAVEQLVEIGILLLLAGVANTAGRA